MIFKVVPDTEIHECKLLFRIFFITVGTALFEFCHHDKKLFFCFVLSLLTFIVIKELNFYQPTTNVQKMQNFLPEKNSVDADTQCCNRTGNAFHAVYFGENYKDDHEQIREPSAARF